MRITIDTKEDSPEDIHKAIELLSKLSGNRHVSQRNFFEDSAPMASGVQPSQSSAPGAGIFNMFNSEPSPSSSSDNDTYQLSDTLKLSTPEKKEEEPKVQIITY